MVGTSYKKQIKAADKAHKKSIKDYKKQFREFRRFVNKLDKGEKDSLNLGGILSGGAMDAIGGIVKALGAASSKASATTQGEIKLLDEAAKRYEETRKSLNEISERFRHDMNEWRDSKLRHL